ncbi:MAG: hypothetical protein AABZ17_15380 [Nitrospirota bacterium]
MPQSIEISMAIQRAGEIIFDETPSQLIGFRTAAGFRLNIPASINLRSNTGDAPLPMVSNCVLLSLSTKILKPRFKLESLKILPGTLEVGIRR